MANLGLFRANKKRRPNTARQPETHLSARWLTSRRDILRAQRLRYRTFSEEFGVRVGPFGIDRDRFDRHCLHLGVEDQATGALVGYTRVLPGRIASRLGCFYSNNEFNLENLWTLPGNTVEIGRTCVHADYRNGKTIATLWAALARYLLEQKVDFLIGCASVSMSDGGGTVAGIMDRLRSRHLTDESLRVYPRLQVPSSIVPGTVPEAAAVMPPLLKAYLRMGAKIAGEPCWDPDFNCADVFIFLEVQRMSARYRDHFFAKAG